MDQKLALPIRPSGSAIADPTRNCLLFASLILTFLIFSLSAHVFAQADISNATLKGKVSDENGSVIAGATVSIKSPLRGSTQTVVTDGSGNYRFPLIQPGTYDIKIDSAGFRSQLIRSVVITVGQFAVFDIELKVGDVSEVVEVFNTGQLTDTERVQQSDTVERRQIETLPNLSRNFTSYVFTLPGAADVAAARVQQSRVINIATSGFSFGAGNGRGNYVSIDGGENESGTGNLRIRNLSIEAVQEFQVNRNSFAAEYGFSASTAVNVITRSGTNAFRGSGYVFYRSDKTSARDALNTNGNKAFEQRISPGFTFSGPIAKKRAFFFTSFEALKYDVARLRSYSANTSLFLPTAAQSSYLQTLTTGPNSTDTTRGIASRLRSVLTTSNYPAPIQLIHQSEGQFVAPTRTYNSTTRLDYEHGKSDLITSRFTFANEDIDLLSSVNVEAPSNGIVQKADDYTVVGTWTHIFDEQLVNQFRVQFAADNYRQDSRSEGSTQIAVAGLITYGHSGAVPFIIDQKRYQFEDTLSWSVGTKDLKFGVSYRPVDAKMVTQVGFQGTFQFGAGLPLTRAFQPGDISILTGPLAPPADTSLTSLQALDLGLPSNWQQSFGIPGFRAWQQSFGSFGQLSWRPVPRLTLNLGARLDYNGEPRPMDRNLNVSPRVGFAWDPFGKGETVIRGGIGIFYAPVSLNVILAATLLSDDGRFIYSPTRSLQDGAQSSAAIWAYGVSLGRLPFGQLSEAEIRAFGIMPSPGQPNRRITAAAADYDNPSMVQASLGLSRKLWKDMVLETAVQMFHGVHLPIAIEGNYRESGQLVTVPGMPGSDLFGPRLERIDPTIAQKTVHSSEGNSIYYGAYVSLMKRFGNRLQFRASYTYSKAIDDTTDFNGGLTPYIPTRRYLDRGLSSFDLRHYFVASGTIDSPYKRRQGENWIKAALADITVSPIVTLRSGFPFNLFIGRDVNGDLNLTDRPYYAPRNSGIGENFYSVDLRASKRFFFSSSSESGSVEVFAEALNLFNHVNYLRVNDVVCGTTAQPGYINGCDPKFLTGPFNFKGIAGLPPTAPLGFVSAAPARQFQFGIKFQI